MLLGREFMELFTSMNRLNRFYTVQVNEICATRKMTSMQFLMLRYIHQSKSCTSMDIVKAWNVEKPTVSEHIRRLHDKGWVAITQGADRRVKNLSLTTEGIAVYEDIIIEVERLQQEVTAIFTEDELDVFTRFVAKLEQQFLSYE